MAAVLFRQSSCTVSELRSVLSFLLVASSLACARSQLGGTMLLAANPEAGFKYFEAW